ncbi:MAG: glycosyltransferase family 2 protein [Solirubrobacterales bacterium]|nr:glycosyltransferase family 2 protein [Solirubrobacterales bacterium]
MSRIAVVIPVHDDGPLVGEAVASVRESEQVELVLVDDGSTDPATLAELDRLRASGVRVIRQDNAGPGAARSAGAAATSAPFVYPLDADDLLVEGALARLADLLEAHPEAHVAWGDYLVFGDYDGRYRSPPSFLPWTLTWVNPYPNSSLIRRDALEQAGGWPDGNYEDWSLWLRFVELDFGGVGFGDIVYRHRLHGAHRVQRSQRRKHRRVYAQLKRRHPEAFGRRAQLLAAERPPAWKRAAYPILFGPRAVVPIRIEAWMVRTMMRRAVALSR